VLHHQNSRGILDSNTIFRHNVSAYVKTENSLEKPVADFKFKIVSDAVLRCPSSLSLLSPAINFTDSNASQYIHSLMQHHLCNVFALKQSGQKVSLKVPFYVLRQTPDGWPKGNVAHPLVLLFTFHSGLASKIAFSAPSKEKLTLCVPTQKLRT